MRSTRKPTRAAWSRSRSAFPATRADIALLAAESIMNLHPYDWWGRDGTPRPWTGEIETLLDRAIGVAPGHPGALHYRVHLYESSAQPARALAAADRLRDLVPGSPHLLHMPAHIYMRTGRYAEATARRTCVPSRPTAATWRRSMRRAPTASAMPRTTTISSGPPRRCKAGAALAIEAARDAYPRRLRPEGGRPHHRHAAAPRRAAAPCAGALREMGRDPQRAAARHTRAVSARGLSLRARHRVCAHREDRPRARTSWRGWKHGRGRPRACEGQGEEHQHCPGARGDRAQHACRGNCACDGRRRACGHLASRRGCARGRPRLRRAAPLAGADAPCAGRGTPCRGTAGTRPRPCIAKT